jgi:hypothetical protein
LIGYDKGIMTLLENSHIFLEMQTEVYGEYKEMDTGVALK